MIKFLDINKQDKPIKNKITRNIKKFNHLYSLTL